MTDFNPILGVGKIRSAFIEWALDHYKNFNCWPGTFIYTAPCGEDIEYTERQVWQAINELPELQSPLVIVTADRTIV
jgi:hypothetical protein